MNKIFTNEQITRIRDQAMLYQCACPSQVCVAIDTLRDLQALQIKCLDVTDTDRAVHDRIKEAAEKSHIEMEKCLADILKLEGWNMDTLDMPDSLRKRPLQDV